MQAPTLTQPIEPYGPTLISIYATKSENDAEDYADETAELQNLAADGIIYATRIA